VKASDQKTQRRAFTDLFTVRDLMGHKKVDTADIYVTATLADMRTAVEAMANRGRYSRSKPGESFTRLSPDAGDARKWRKA